MSCRLSIVTWSYYQIEGYCHYLISSFPDERCTVEIPALAMLVSTLNCFSYTHRSVITTLLPQNIREQNSTSDRDSTDGSERIRHYVDALFFSFENHRYYITFRFVYSCFQVTSSPPCWWSDNKRFITVMISPPWHDMRPHFCHLNISGLVSNW